MAGFLGGLGGTVPSSNFVPKTDGSRPREGAARPPVVVVVPPRREHLSDLGQRAEDLDVQALVAQASIEALDEVVLRRSSRPDERQLRAAPARPANSLPSSTVIDAGRPRSPVAASRAAATSAPTRCCNPTTVTRSRVFWCAKARLRTGRSSSSCAASRPACPTLLVP